jgi:hypothetical protein
MFCISLFSFCHFSFGHCVVCSSVFWPLCCLSFCLLAIVLSVLLSFGHCVVCPSVFWPLCYLSFCLLAIVLSVLLSFGHCVICPSVFWPLCCLSVFDLWSLITSLVYSNSSQQYSLLGLFIKKNKQNLLDIYVMHSCIITLFH